jgi:stearoyl-CoA desaturase (delta-9 desaturase)
MLKLYTHLKNMSIYSQVLIVHSILYATILLGLVYAFDWKLLLEGIAIGWVLFWIGGSVGLHRFISHRTFEAKNRFIKWILLWASAQCTLGSVPGFAAAHRLHHKNSDTELDPFKLTDSAWHNFKLWAYHFPKIVVSPRSIVDLLGDKDFKCAHEHYWAIWSVYPIIVLLTGGPIAFVYFVAVPIVYVICGMGYVTVIAHSTVWRRWFNGTSEFETNDASWDGKFFTYVFVGEGFHHSHHNKPGNSDYTIPGKQFDITGWAIRYLKK